MIINSSSMSMASQRSYEKKVTTKYQSQMSKADNAKASYSEGYSSTVRISELGLQMLQDSQENGRKETELNADSETESKKDQGNQNTNDMAGVTAPFNGQLGLQGSLPDVRLASLKSFLSLIRLMSGGKNSKALDDLEALCNRQENESKQISLSSQLRQQISGQAISITIGNGTSSSGNNNTVTWNRTIQASSFMKEEENTTFKAQGNVITADGRTLNFGVEVEMSRKFMEATEMKVSDTVTYKLTDPLVINLDSNPTSISDQKFLFDIDNDGIVDEISKLDKGSGFLVLDKNNDGIINNGSELFGTKSGDGFKDLAEYDSDGNGWIDELDKVYSQLKVWTKDEKGNDVLLTLKQADVGAIYLGKVKSSFDLTSEEDNSLNGVIRSTGVYLKESTGAAGTVQQVDFAKK